MKILSLLIIICVAGLAVGGVDKSREKIVFNGGVHTSQLYFGNVYNDRYESGEKSTSEKVSTEQTVETNEQAEGK